MSPSGSAGHAGGTANLKLTFHLDHSAGADQPGAAQRYWLGVASSSIVLITMFHFYPLTIIHALPKGGTFFEFFEGAHDVGNIFRSNYPIIVVAVFFDLASTKVSFPLLFLLRLCWSPTRSTVRTILFIIAARTTRITEYLAIVAKPEVLCLHAGYQFLLGHRRWRFTNDGIHLSWEVGIVGLSLLCPCCQEQHSDTG